MINKNAAVAILAGVAMVLSGCISGGADDAAPNEADDGMTKAKDTDSALPGFQVDMKDCREGGGVSVYNSQKDASGPAPPLTRADISDLVGNPVIGTYFQPITSDYTTGIWHISVDCAEHSVKMPSSSSGSMGGHGHETAPQDGEAAESADHHGPLEWGWVGVRINPPEWDDSGIEHQFYIPDLSFMNKQIVDVLREELLIHASLMLDGKIDWVGPAAVHQVMDDEDHGVFQTHATMKEYKDFEVERMRFWLYVDMSGNYNYGHDHLEGEDPDAGHGYMPVAIDLVNNVEGATHYTAVDGLAFLSHTRTNHHGEAGGAAGNTGAVLFEGFDRTLTIGPMPDVHLEDTWLH